MFATRDSFGYCDWPQSNAEKRGAVKVKLFLALRSFFNAYLWSIELLIIVFSHCSCVVLLRFTTSGEFFLIYLLGFISAPWS